MKNIFRFLKDSKQNVFIIVLLLILQAYCDLSLPSYTSNILNVGLQQNGIEDAVPNSIRSASLEDLYLFMSDEDIDVVEDSYSNQEIRYLKDGIDRSSLNAILAKPESIVFQLDRIPNYSISDIKQMMDAGLMTKEQLMTQIDNMMTDYEGMSDTYLNQIAVQYVAKEYEAQNIDVTEIQNQYLLSVGMKMVLMALLMSASAILIGLLASRTSARIGMNLRESVYKKVMQFSSEQMERFSTASLITRCTNDIQQVQFVIVMMLRMVAYAPILGIFGIIKVIETGSGMSWIIVMAVILLAALVGILIAIAMPKFKKMQTLVDRLNLVSRELLTGIMPIRAFNREQYEENRFEKANYDLYSTQLFTSRTMAFMMPVMMLIMNGISVLIVWVGASKVDLGTIQVGDLTAFITYSMVIVIGFLMLSAISIVLPRAGVAADRIVEVLDTPLTLYDPESPQDEKISNGIVEFKNVGFVYPGANEEAVEDISFMAKPGETTAIIGSTGCGKSTLLNLIMRFYDVTNGEILLDGIDIRELTQKKLRDQIGYVPQKGILFSGTVESNIKYADMNISDEDMKAAAKIAQADFIEDMPEGFNSAIAQEGSNVSGGQRQRISIARAIAKHPKIYLFDDSFSALDYKTDLALRTELNKHIEDATVIIVAQRISTILHADKILCMEDGRIVGQGTHEQLMQTCPTYLEIAKSQLSEAELSKTGGVL